MSSVYWFNVADPPAGPDSAMFNFGSMWISKACRLQSIGKQLLAMVKQEVRIRNIKNIYVSATPVPATVQFYINEGCTLLTDPDPELFALEPEDIHMELNI